MTKSTRCNNRPNWDVRVTLQVLFSSQANGILKRECAVLPRGSKSAAMPEEATQSTNLPFERKWWYIALYRKVLPVPPGPCMKK